MREGYFDVKGEENKNGVRKHSGSLDERRERTHNVPIVPFPTEDDFLMHLEVGQGECGKT